MNLLHHQVLRPPIESAQYTSTAFGTRCRQAGIAISMGRRGDAYDNAVAESFFATLETELLMRTSFANRNQARSEVFDHTSKTSTTHTGGIRPSDTTHPPTTKGTPNRPNYPANPQTENCPQKRGNSNPDKVRTPKQRLADAAFELFTNRDAFTGEPITETTGIKAKASTQLILTAPIGVVDGTNPNGQVEIIGTGPVPRQILQTLTPDTELAAIIFDRAGRPLWLGRNQRLGNAAQRLAVAVRDGGCFECGAPMHRCELHHIQQWHRDNGPTNIDNLVAVCRQHHKWLETENLTVRRTPTGYQTQPRAGPRRE